MSSLAFGIQIQWGRRGHAATYESVRIEIVQRLGERQMNSQTFVNGWLLPSMVPLFRSCDMFATCIQFPARYERTRVADRALR